MAFYDLSLARTVASSVDIRPVRVRGDIVYCVRSATASPTEAPRVRHVLVLVAPRPVDANVLEQAREAFNRQYDGSPFDGETLAEELSHAVAGQWPGSAVYYVRVPISR